jgi:hypothetical protein
VQLNVAVTDNKVTVTCPTISSALGTTYMAAGATIQCLSAPYTITGADESAQQVTNTATATVGQCCCDAAGAKSMLGQSECTKGGKGKCVKMAACKK